MAECSELIIETTGHAAAKMGFIGSVADFPTARLPDTLSNRTFLAANYLYGFEQASPRGKYSLGEAVIVNGVCYATSSDITSSDYNHMIYGRKFATEGVFIIPRGVEPSHKGTFKSAGSNINLMDVYQKIYEKVKQPAVFVGIVEFSNFHGTAIGKSPIDEKTTFDNKNGHSPNPEIKSANVTALLIGVLTDYNDAEFSVLNKQLEIILYKNPADMDQVLTCHAHTLTLRQSVNRIEDINPDLVEGSLHLLTDGNSIRSLQADIYAISGLDDYENIT